MTLYQGPQMKAKKSKWKKVETPFAGTCSQHPSGAIVFRNGLEKWGYRLSNGKTAFRQFEKKSTAVQFVEANDPAINLDSTSVSERDSNQLQPAHLSTARVIVVKIEQQCKEAGLRAAQSTKESALNTEANFLPLDLLSIINNIKGRSAGEFRVSCISANVQIGRLESELEPCL